jgi:ParB family chromosome partitioning protein
MSLNKIFDIQTKDIEVSDENIRVHSALRDLDQLAASIQKLGLLQPIVLLGSPGSPPYEVISGQRRLLAHRKLKAKTIRAVFAGDLDKTEATVRSLVENMQRVDPEYTDTAKAVTYLYEKFRKDEQKVKEATGLSLRTIRDYIMVEARANPRIKGLMEAKKISPVDVKRAIRAAQGNLKKAEELVDLIIEQKPTAHQKRRLVLYGEREKGASAKKILEEAMVPTVEQNLIVSLPDELRKALVKATRSMAMEPEELAAKVLGDWLQEQGFA